MYHIANLLWIFAAFSIVLLIMDRYLYLGLPIWLKVTFYSLVFVGAILRFLAKSKYPEIKDPIIENKLSRLLYYGGNIAFLILAFMVVSFHVRMHIFVLAAPLLLLLPSWVISLSGNQDTMNTDVLDDNFLDD